MNWGGVEVEAEVSAVVGGGCVGGWEVELVGGLSSTNVGIQRVPPETGYLGAGHVDLLFLKLFGLLLLLLDLQYVQVVVGYGQRGVVRM